MSNKLPRCFTRVFFWPLYTGLLLAQTLNAHALDTSAQHIRHQMGGWSGDIQLYQAGLLNLLLKVSEPEFGPYTLELDSRLLTGSRWVKAMSNGALHTSFRAGAPSLGEDTGAMHWYRQPFLKSMLGLRRLLVRREDLDKFASVKSLEDLKQLSIGQGDSWPDRFVYNSAGVTVVEGKSIEHLIRMLDKKRFDFLALSVLEIEGVFTEYLTLYPDLVLVDDLYIYYPIPVYLTVSKMKPYVVARLRAGMKILFEQDSGKRLDDIFHQYFPLESRVLVTPRTRLISLQNPKLSAELAAGIDEYFYSRIWHHPKH